MLPLLPGVRVELQGTCNRCGLCCTAEHEGKRVVCEHLRADLGPSRQAKPLGHPEASACSIYEQRRQWPRGRQVPVKMLDAQGTPRLIAHCSRDTWQEDHVIVDRGIGRGCSLSIPVSEGQLVSFEPAKR